MDRGQISVPAGRNSDREVFYLSIIHALQEAGYKRMETGKGMSINYCRQFKTKKLYKLAREKKGRS